MRTPQLQLASRISGLTGDVELFHACRDLRCSPGRGSCALTLLLIPSSVNYLLSLSVALCHRLGWSSLCLPTGCHVWAIFGAHPASETLTEETKAPCHTTSPEPLVLSLQHSQETAQKLPFALALKVIACFYSWQERGWNCRKQEQSIPGY